MLSRAFRTLTFKTKPFFAMNKFSSSASPDKVPEHKKVDPYKLFVLKDTLSHIRAWRTQIMIASIPFGISVGAASHMLNFPIEIAAVVSPIAPLTLHYILWKTETEILKEIKDEMNDLNS